MATKTADAGIEFVEDVPQTRRQATSKWAERLAPLVDNPGKWARIFEGSETQIRSVSAALKSRRYTIPNPDDVWDFRSRKDPERDGFGYVYGRYLGPEGEAE